MKNIILVSLVTLLSFPTLAETCGQHLDKGIPSSNSDQFLCRDGYAVGYNYNTKNADWVAYHITAESVNITNKRSNAFQEDTEMPDYARSTLADYKGSGYDRGHLAPSATMDFTQESMKQSFLMSNMSPQLPGFNRVGWRVLEEHVRDLANVVTGPIYQGNEGTIGNGVVIPSAFYKVILDPSFDEAIAFIVPHRDVSSSELANFITTIDEVERQTGLDFFAQTPDSIEDNMESVKWEEMWPTNQ
ncbi:DNA/RNA non-specific endonuclease [Vibrio parahaemolyticus]|uniref:DNA/RNA non-specific endonuclease n=1 Tax=Vibrio parahaemolyticus TaxID=670 RepID=UPI00042A357E|nr:DNA/RNA non-specific endonuclease [Vibrio parahaemolyticus]KIT43248.1 DNA/RNA endonuclease G [Vibrio parahaemolyticus 3644]KIT54810.1 DNA/RNA endonuclease G [Vibrio parahaemolyticus EN9701072]EGQ8243830.1 DNA/RNA non-specific endonuclease [Vibrio parahaemolyticus]EGQ8386774.1 DNA/RNA non-specific endonuclease [Vibrio parahaemolyticus]EGQ8387910.1 DNA/RNA non-specific endonuclease [Vibrio parahaemolyticus]